MTSVSPIPSWNPSPSRALSAAANKADAAPSPAPSPSSIVAIGSRQVIADLTPSPKIWESPSRDGVSEQMTKNFFSRTVGGRFAGLGASLLEQIKGGVRNVSQAVQQSPPRMEPNTYSDIGAMQAASLHGNGEDKVTLGITTRSGVEVKLSLDSQDDGLAVRMSTSGELSEAEAGALGGLAQAFQEAIDGMAQGQPKISLSGLMQFDQNVLASVNLHAEVTVRTEPQSTQTLDFQADSAQRRVSFKGVAGSLDVKVDASQLNALGSQEQQAKAMSSYMKQIGQAASRGHGDPALMAMFKDAFGALHSNAAAPQDARGVPAAGKWRLAAEDKAILTGMADFSASVSQTPKSINSMRLAETDGFNYELSQQTTLAGASQDERSIRQQQQSRLSASFHMPLIPGVPLRLTEAVESQNYTYHQIEDTASSDAQLAYKEGKLVKASLQQTATQSTHVMTYVMGKLESDTTTPTQHSVQRDLLTLLWPYKTGTTDQTVEGRAERHKQDLLTLNDEIMLQSYPGQWISPWQGDAMSAAQEASNGAAGASAGA